jgi:hypothetical protein
MIVTYELATGRITGAHEIHGDEAAYIENLAQYGQGGLRLGIDGNVFYVKDGAIVPRPDSGISLDTNTIAVDGSATLSGVRKGARVRITGPVRAEAEGTGRDIILSFALPGVYEIQVDAFPARDAILRLSVTA